MKSVKKCPNLENGVCNTWELVLHYDREVLKCCGLAEGIKIFWNDFAKLVEERIISSGERQKICGNCQWSSICSKKVEKSLLETEKIVLHYKKTTGGKENESRI